MSARKDKSDKTYDVGLGREGKNYPKRGGKTLAGNWKGGHSWVRAGTGVIKNLRGMYSGRGTVNDLLMAIIQKQ